MKWSCISDTAKFWNVNPEDVIFRAPDTLKECCAVWDVYECMFRFVNLTCRADLESFKDYLKFLDSVRNYYENNGCKKYPYSEDDTTNVCLDGAIALHGLQNLFNCFLLLFIVLLVR